MCKSVHPTEVYVPTVFFIENIYCFNMLVNTKVEGIKDSAQPNLTLLLVFLYVRVLRIGPQSLLRNLKGKMFGT